MRRFVIAAVIVGAASAIPLEAKAQYARWCAIYNLSGATNCGFYTYAQCRADISGIGGSCYRNPAVATRASRKSQYYR